MDVLAAVITKIYDLLYADTTLKGIVSTRIYPNWQPADTEMPYITQFVEVRDTGDPLSVIQQGTLTLHLWSDSPTATEITNMRARCMVVLDQLNWTTTDINNCRTWLQSSGMIPDEPGIWHCVLMFNIRFYRKTEIAAIISR